MARAQHTHPTRWRCGDPTCPAHQWQRVELGDIEAAQAALERHWRDAHEPAELADAQLGWIGEETP